MSSFRGHDDHPRPVEGCALCARLLREPPLPGVVRMAGNYLASMARHLWGGGGETPELEAKRRLSLCLVCPSLRHSDGRCGVSVAGEGCGCPVQSKVKRPRDRCPLGKWEAVG